MDAEALAAFKAALRPSSTSEDFLDAAYAAKRIGRNQEARNYFAKAIEALPPNKPVDPAQRFGLRREVESLSRTWGASLGTDYHQGGILPGFTNNQKVVQQGAEVYYQPEFLTSRGRMVQFYVQGFENLYDAQGGATGGPTLQPSIGLRAKPFESQNLVLAAQRLFLGGRYTQQDWLLRVAYSADRGTDLQAGASAWTYWQVYTEGAYFIDAKRYIHTLEARWGGSWRLGPLEGLVATPHLVLAGDFDNQNVQRTSSGLGAGLALRQWFRQNKTMAPASWAEFSIQYRAKLGNADRGGGFFARLSFWF
jgi:tetratricopeptide (TPR) repeat protein